MHLVLRRSIGSSHGFRIILLLVALVFFTADLQAASEPEVEVIGCVVDYGGKPYRNIWISLYGLNYNGGAEYNGNNSVGTTDERGEFSVRMKAGLPGVDAQPAQARIHGEFRGYVTKGWTGGRTDAWPKIIVSNIGERVDLHPKGCIKFSYPIDVSGVVFNDELEDSGHPDGVGLRLSVGDDYVEVGASIPASGYSSQKFYFGVDLIENDAYEIKISRQPKNMHCEVKRGIKGTIGGVSSEIKPIEMSYNGWATTTLEVRCTEDEETRVFYRKRDEREAALSALGEEMVARTRFDLHRTEGREAFLQACDERIASARRRIAYKTDKAKCMRAAGNAMQASEARSGLLRTADKPLLSVGGRESSTEEIDSFYRAWDEREATLYELGEKMLGSNGFNLQTRAGRAAFLQACDERIAAACSRVEDGAGKTKEDEQVILLPRNKTSASDLIQSSIKEANDPSAKADRLAREAGVLKQNKADTEELQAAMGQLVGVIEKHKQAKQDRKQEEQQNRPYGAIAECTPGRTYDAHKCNCLMNPKDAGC